MTAAFFTALGFAIGVLFHRDLLTFRQRRRRHGIVEELKRQAVPEVVEL